MAEWLAMESTAEIKRMEERRRIQNTGDAEKSGETILDVVVGLVVEPVSAPAQPGGLEVNVFIAAFNGHGGRVDVVANVHLNRITD